MGSMWQWETFPTYFTSRSQANKELLLPEMTAVTSTCVAGQLRAFYPLIHPPSTVQGGHSNHSSQMTDLRLGK